MLLRFVATAIGIVPPQLVSQCVCGSMASGKGRDAENLVKAQLRFCTKFFFVCRCQWSHTSLLTLSSPAAHAAPASTRARWLGLGRNTVHLQLTKGRHYPCFYHQRYLGGGSKRGSSGLCKGKTACDMTGTCMRSANSSYEPEASLSGLAMPRAALE